MTSVSAGHARIIAGPRRPRDFFHRVDEPMRRMCDLLRQERAPAGIIVEYRARE